MIARNNDDGFDFTALTALPLFEDYASAMERRNIGLVAGAAADTFAAVNSRMVTMVALRAKRAWISG